MQNSSRLDLATSSLASTLFPDVYRDEAPTLVALMRAYLEWAETEGVTYHARRLLDYGDLDLAPDEYLARVRSKFLDGVAIPPSANVRMLLRHVTDLLRARGTERAVDAFFRLAYGAGASAYLPSRDLLRPSSGRYVSPRYLEVSIGAATRELVGHVVRGHRSGATGFVERAFRKLVKGKLVESLAISGLAGHFVTGELVDYDEADATHTAAVRVVGSTTTIDVADGAAGLSVGDVLKLAGGEGSGGYARVTETEDAAGRVSFTLVDGGFGYTTNSECLVSENVVTVSSVSCDRALNATNNYFLMFETLEQVVANASYAAANPARGETLAAYDANGTQVATCLVLASSVANSTSNVASMSLSSVVGNAAAIALVNSATRSITLTTIDVTTTTGRVMSETNGLTLTLDAAAALTPGETLTQDATGARGVVTSVSGNVVTLRNRTGVVASALPVVGSRAGFRANVVSVAIGVGVDGVSGGFVADAAALTVATTSNTRALGVSTVSAGTGAHFVVTGVDDTETLYLDSDLVSASLDVALDAAAYALPANTAGNSSGPVLGELLSYANVVVGRVSEIRRTSPGVGYTAAPLARVHEPATLALLRTGWVADVSGSSTFAPGELLTQESSGARGIVVSSNSSQLAMRRASLLADMVVTDPLDASTQLVSVESAGVATVSALRPLDLALVSDIDGAYDGLAAVVVANTVVTNGVAVAMVAHVSGFGYVEGDTVGFTSPDGSSGLGLVRLGREGVGPGFYATTPGAPSAGKHLQDGRYWQEMSYEIRSSVSPTTYEAAMRFLHPAGVARFSRLRHDGEAGVEPEAAPTVITQG